MILAETQRKRRKNKGGVERKNYKEMRSLEEETFTITFDEAGMNKYA